MDNGRCAWHRKEDFIRILTEPENNMIRQQQALLATEGIDLHFTEDAIQEVRFLHSLAVLSVQAIGTACSGLSSHCQGC